MTALSQWVTTPDFNAHATKGIDEVYNLDFEKAKQEFSYLERTYPSHPAGKFFLAMIDWWNILLDIDDDSKDDRFFDKLDGVIDLCDSLLDINENDVSALFFKGGALGYRGRLHANRGHWLRAANDGRLALPIVQHAYKIAPNNYDILLGMGIYNYYAAIIPEEYPIVKPLMLFFPSGNKKLGIHQLQEASEKAQFAAVESQYFLLQLNYSYEHRYDTAYVLAASLFARYPNNVIFHRYLGRTEYALNRYQDAEKTFSEVWLRCEKNQRGYFPPAEREAFYYLGLCALNLRRYDEAVKYFIRCDSLNRRIDTDDGTGYTAMANLKMGMAYDGGKERSLAEKQYRKVLGMRNYESSHDLAEKYLKTPFSQ